MTFEFARGEVRAPAEGLGLHVVGVDLSMTSTGVAVIRPGTEHRRVHLVESGPNIPDGADPYPWLYDRLRHIGRRIRFAAFNARQRDDRTLIVFEGPRLGGKTQQQHRHTMSWLWGRTYEVLSREGAVVVVPPASLKRYVTGNGNASKEDMVAAAVATAFPGIDFRHRGRVKDDLVDAYGLAAMGCRELGYAVEPSAQRVTPSALEPIKWHEPRPSSTDTTKGITT